MSHVAVEEPGGGSAGLLYSTALTHSQTAPYDPWLFSRRAGEWHFVTWSVAAAELRRRTAGLGRLQGRTVAYCWRDGVTGWLDDLALQGAGAAPHPIVDGGEGSAGATPLGGAGLWIDAARPPCLVESERAAGEMRRDGEGGPDGGLDPVLRLDRSLGLRPSRDILLSWDPPIAAGPRLLLSWATWRGAAVIFASHPDLLLPTLWWARPTIVGGSLETLRELRRALDSGVGRRRSRRRFRRARGRLRAFVLLGGEAPDEAQQSFWGDLDVELVSA